APRFGVLVREDADFGRAGGVEVMNDLRRRAVVLAGQDVVVATVDPGLAVHAAAMQHADGKLIGVAGADGVERVVLVLVHVARQCQSPASAASATETKPATAHRHVDAK